MGRKLEFSKDKALLQAMEGFWSKGYDATSMRDLAQRLDLHLGSVYNALGDKEQVFESALRLYLEHHVTPRLDELYSKQDPQQALRDYIALFANDCSSKTGMPGCFFVNSLLHINDINANISAAVRDYIDMSEKALSSCIGRAQTTGQIKAEENALRLAHFVFAGCKSMHVMKKIGANDDYINDIRSGIETRLFGNCAA